jgi:hypothetical protein
MDENNNNHSQQKHRECTMTVVNGPTLLFLPCLHGQCAFFSFVPRVDKIKQSMGVDTIGIKDSFIMYKLIYKKVLSI